MSALPVFRAARPRTAELVRDRLGAAGSPRCELGWAGPVRAPLADEVAVQAACGIMQVHGRAAGRPRELGVAGASVLAGALAAHGELAAAIARARGGRVERVRTSVAQAALFGVRQYLAVAAREPDAHPGGAGRRPPFTSADGIRFELETLDAEPWLGFWLRLGAGTGAISRGWFPFQQRFATARCALPAELHEVAGRARFAAVRAAAAAHGVSVLAVRHDPEPPREVPAWESSPLPGAAAASAALPGPGSAPLAGLVAVECTRRVQGPVAGLVLAMLGAEVIRVEPPGGDPMRGVPPMAGACSARYRALNDGKRTVEVDIKSAAGRRELRELVAGAEVFVHNWAPGRAARLGLDATDLARARPGLVYAAAAGWDPAAGPDPPLGTDFLVQAGSGLAAALTPAGEPVAPTLLTLTDVLGGLVCAHGVLAALLRRIRTGTGSRVDSSLFSAAGLVPRAARARPRPWDGPLRTADGFAVLPETTAPEAATALFGAAPERIARRCREEPTATWVARGAALDLVLTPVCADLGELVADARFAPALGRTGHGFAPPPWEFS
ncbi:CoA transferase [Saccharopolyspora sp. MS10]|uniref:CoA transferase n=1 Tax=Saccharopolyspora sp. MS10 TaxID=3385973 RepID=UPI0039A28AB7